MALSLRQLEENRRHLPDGALPANPEKNPKVFGKAVVDPARLKKRLGPVTWRVWWHLERTCSPVTGAYFMARDRAALALGISENALKKAISRLYAAGLVQESHRRKRNDGSWFVQRMVYGHWAEMPGRRTLLVPIETVQWLSRPERRGGARPGAGRPKGEFKRGPERAPRNSNGGREQSNGAPPKLPAVEDPQVLPYGRTPGQGPALLSVVQATGGGTEGYVAPQLGLTESVGGEVGGVLRGRVTNGGRPPPPGSGGVPRFPGPTVMPPATVPGPPLLPPGLSDAAAVDWLLKAYRGAVEAKTKKKCWVLARPGEAVKSKLFPELLKAARQLEDYEYRPGAWVMWRLDSWAEMHPRGKKPAPIQWVFSIPAMDDHGQWFESEAGSYSAPRVIYNPFAQDVLRRFQAMQMDLLAKGAVGEAAVREVVAKHWPGDAYRQAIAKANARTQEDQTLINQRIQRGSWVWT